MDNKAKCNECGQMSKMKQRVRRLKDKIDMHYFKCDHCNHIYIICYMDETIRRKHKKIRKLIDRKYKTDEHYKEIELLNHEIKQDMDVLASNLSTT